MNLKHGLWKGVLSAAHGVSIIPCQRSSQKLIRRLKFNVPRLVTYRILCEGLDAVGEIMDAIECFHQMTNELTEERVAQDEQASWVLGEQSYKQYGWRF